MNLSRFFNEIKSELGLELGDTVHSHWCSWEEMNRLKDEDDDALDIGFHMESEGQSSAVVLAPNPYDCSSAGIVKFQYMTVEGDHRDQVRVFVLDLETGGHLVIGLRCILAAAGYVKHYFYENSWFVESLVEQKPVTEDLADWLGILD